MGDIFFIRSFGEGKIEPTVIDKTLTQTVVSSHVVDNIFRTVAHASVKTRTKNWHLKFKDIYNTYVQKFSMIFVHDSPHQKQNFLNYFACHFHHPSQLWEKKLQRLMLLFQKHKIIQNDLQNLQFIKKVMSPYSVSKCFSFCTVKSFLHDKMGSCSNLNLHL